MSATTLPPFPPDLRADERLHGAFLHAYRGSIAHGMHVPSTDPDSIDDIDTMAFVVPSAETYLGLDAYGSRGTVEIKRGEWDIVAYESRKALSLLLKGNPNVLSMLWVPDEFVIERTDAGRMLREHRDVFVGRHVYNPFIGYAIAQMSKMQGGSYEGYMGARRKALVERHGYDTKNAAHLIRLLRMGIEFLRDGVLNVYREDAQELLAIKRGEWSLEHVKREARVLMAKASDTEIKSTLPARPDREAVNRLAVDIAYEGLRLP